MQHKYKEECFPELSAANKEQKNKKGASLGIDSRVPTDATGFRRAAYICVHIREHGRVARGQVLVLTLNRRERGRGGEGERGRGGKRGKEGERGRDGQRAEQGKGGGKDEGCGGREVKREQEENRPLRPRGW